jgi:hypothetical protein
MLIPAGLALICIGSAALLYLTGVIRGPSLPVSEPVGFALIAVSAAVVIAGVIVLVKGLA